MYEKELQLAVIAAKKAGERIAFHHNLPYDVIEKSVDQPVTIADREANQEIQKILLSAYPQDGWFSEETIDTPERLLKKRVWIVDPLDGTKEFIKKVPEFAVSIALTVERKAVVGVIYNPLSGELFQARLGGGAFLNDAKIQVTAHADLKTARILASRSELARKEWVGYEGEFQIVPAGGMAFKMAQVAKGFADGGFSRKPKNEWDFAAGIILIEEAGGLVSNPDGSPFILNKKDPKALGIVYGNPPIQPQLLKYTS